MPSLWQQMNHWLLFQSHVCKVVTQQDSGGVADWLSDLRLHQRNGKQNYSCLCYISPLLLSFFLFFDS